MTVRGALPLAERPFGVRLARWSEAWLRFPRATRVASIAAFVLCAPGPFVGIFMDDYFQLLQVRGFPGVGSAYDLFRFAPGDPSRMVPFIWSGPFPWWTHPQLKLAFWRPLSCALANLDVALFDRSETAFHLHSSLWYVGLVLTAALVLRRALPGALGAGALLLFAFSPTHAMPALWVANRNALVAAVPALLGLAAHLRWREEGWRPGLPLSLCGFAVGLAGGESALGVFAYLGAYETLGAPGGAKRRFVALAPAAALVAAYAYLYRALGMGAWGSSIYLDPRISPAAFLAAAPGRVAVLLGNQMGLPTADLWLAGVGWRPVLVGVGAFVTLCAAALLRSAWRGLAPAERRSVRWLLAGALGALVPVLATFPASRLLLVPSLGACAALAVLLRHCFRSAVRVEQLAGTALALAHGPCAVTGWAFVALVFGHGGHWVDAVSLSAEFDEARLPGQRVVLLAAPDPALAIYPPLVRTYRGRVAPRAWLPLSFAPYAHRFTRTGVDSFELEVLDGRMLETVFEQLVRSPELPVAVGEPVLLDGLTVTVLAERGGGPTRVAFKADRPLEDPSFWFLQWKDQALRHFVMPQVGQSVLLSKEAGLLPQ